jgi:hypothetical protein
MRTRRRSRRGRNLRDRLHKMLRPCWKKSKEAKRKAQLKERRSVGSARCQQRCSQQRSVQPCSAHELLEAMQHHRRWIRLHQGWLRTWIRGRISGAALLSCTMTSST